jgi:hypothetical protein
MLFSSSPSASCPLHRRFERMTVARLIALGSSPPSKRAGKCSYPRGIREPPARVKEEFVYTFALIRRMRSVPGGGKSEEFKKATKSLRNMQTHLVLFLGRHKREENTPRIYWRDRRKRSY